MLFLSGPSHGRYLIKVYNHPGESVAEVVHFADHKNRTQKLSLGMDFWMPALFFYLKNLHPLKKYICLLFQLPLDT